MKKYISTIVLCVVACSLYAQIATEKKATWDYPVKPGTEEWRESSYEAKIKKSQPSKELLNSWDTETLFRYCINYLFNQGKRTKFLSLRDERDTRIPMEIKDFRIEKKCLHKL